MIKRALTLFFILFTNFILLAHAVVPHHHHITEICTEESNCQSESHDDEHSEENKQHDEDKSDNDHCVLKQALIIPTNNVKPEIKIIESWENIYQSSQSQAIFTIQNLILPITVYTFRGNQYSKTKFHDYYIGNSLSLRAPPSV